MIFSLNLTWQKCSLSLVSVGLLDQSDPALQDNLAVCLDFKK